MPFGPGRYGANAAALLKQLGGELCVVILMGGPQGHAFDVATTDPALARQLPTILREVADKLDADYTGGAPPS